MKSNNINVSKNCPIRNGLRVLGGRWSLVVLFELRQPRRYGGLKKCIPDISEKMLIQTLRLLTLHKLIRRKDYKEIPPHVEYSITTKGLRALKIVEVIKGLSL